MVVYMILREGDKIYPECVFVTDNKEKAEEYFEKLAGTNEIKSYQGKRWFFKDFDVYVLTKRALNRKDTRS